MPDYIKRSQPIPGTRGSRYVNKISRYKVKISGYLWRPQKLKAQEEEAMLAIHSYSFCAINMQLHQTKISKICHTFCEEIHTNSGKLRQMQIIYHTCCKQTRSHRAPNVTNNKTRVRVLTRINSKHLLGKK